MSRWGKGGGGRYEDDVIGGLAQALAVRLGQQLSGGGAKSKGKGKAV